MTFDQLELKFAKTLWQDVYRLWILNEEGMQIASLRVIPCLPLEEEEMPPNAPDVGPVLLVTVDAAEVAPTQILEWENALALKILAQFSHQEPLPRECQFFYPSPLEVHFNEIKKG